ncbi:MAG: MerR family transcriptional regulator, partial [Planctomycetes bacterium]|nr:MerR family transcriptional regulator [Planctomycetota bacterium]
MSEDANYTIGRLAEAAGVPTSTVRYYERRGLLTSEARSQGNYRLYGPAALERLRFVRSAQAAGFTLSDITLLLRFRDGDPAPYREVQGLITKRLTRVAEQIEQLKGVE